MHSPISPSEEQLLKSQVSYLICSLLASSKGYRGSKAFRQTLLKPKSRGTVNISTKGISANWPEQGYDDDSYSLYPLHLTSSCFHFKLRVSPKWLLRPAANSLNRILSSFCEISRSIWDAKTISSNAAFKVTPTTRSPDPPSLARRCWMAESHGLKITRQFPMACQCIWVEMEVIKTIVSEDWDRRRQSSSDASKCVHGPQISKAMSWWQNRSDGKDIIHYYRGLPRSFINAYQYETAKYMHSFQTSTGVIELQNCAHNVLHAV